MIRLIACGKVKEKWMRDGIEEYAKRIQPYEKLEIVEVKDEKTLDNNSEAENTRVKNIEGDRLLKCIKEDDCQSRVSEETGNRRIQDTHKTKKCS